MIDLPSIDQIFQWYEVDSKVNTSNLDLESVRIPALHYKYLLIHTEYKKHLSKLQRGFYELELNKIEYYTGRMSSDKLKSLGWIPFGLRVLRNEVEMYLLADAEYMNSKDQLDEVKQIIDALERIITEINNRQWSIRNMIEWKKWTNGSI